MWKHGVYFMCAKYVVIAVDIDDAPPTCVMRGIEGARLTHQTSAHAQYYCGGPLWGSRPKFGACRHLVPVSYSRSVTATRIVDVTKQS